jgi:hypothetical protein
MKIKKPLLRYLALLIAAIFLLQMVGCGTIIYPERRGQQSGRVDVGIAVLDGLGLLLFIIPGVIAFAVDFSTGAIYLPSGKSKTAKGLEHGELSVISTSPDGLNLAKLDKILMDYTGEEVNLDSNTLLVYEADANRNIEKQLRKLAQ